MSASHIFRVVYIVGCMTLVVSSIQEDVAKEFMEHVLRIPNPDKVLNTVLGRLERNQELAKERRRFAPEIDCEDPTVVMPEYTESLESSSEREPRQLGPQVSPLMVYCDEGEKLFPDASHLMKHYPICHMERKIRRLNTNKYEYRPAYYEEVRCLTVSRGDEAFSNEICSSLGFSCVQWNKTIHLTRRLYTSDCWESKTMVISAGCECMWPVHRLGDISMYIPAP